MTDVLSTDDEGYLSRFDGLCQGARDQNRYFLALNVSAAKVERRFSHPGSSNLDEICAFDLAETQRMNLGQLNLIRVSSFCGPEGIIWGYDVARPEGLCDAPLFSLDGVPVYDGNPLMDAAAELFGTVAQRRFPIMPGSHTPSAYKSIEVRGPGTVYAAFGLGIPTDRASQATILMEDVGLVPEAGLKDPHGWRTNLAYSLAESVIAVAANQRTRCARIFVLYAQLDVKWWEVGCAVSLARKAIPEGGIAKLRETSLADWRKLVVP